MDLHVCVIVILSCPEINLIWVKRVVRCATRAIKSSHTNILAKYAIKSGIQLCSLTNCFSAFWIMGFWDHSRVIVRIFSKITFKSTSNAWKAHFLVSTRQKLHMTLTFVFLNLQLKTWMKLRVMINQIVILLISPRQLNSIRLQTGR